MLLVQKYLKNHSLNDLAKEHGVYGRVLEHKICLNYDQIEVTDNHPLSQECRGLILYHNHNLIQDTDIVGETTVASYPFKRFFNMGDNSAANVDFSNAKFYTKLDGTMINFYFDKIKNDWCVATRSMSEATLPIDGFANYTFTSLFHEAIKYTTGYDYFDWINVANLNKNLTYIFELCTPLNRIVVNYKNYNVWLTGVRDLLSLQEHDIHICDNIYIPLCPTYDINNINHMIDIVTNANPLELEGMVVCDHMFRRVKVKNPSYVAYNRIRDSVANSPRALMQIVLNDKLDDLSCVMQDNIKQLGESYRVELTKLFHSFQNTYETCIQEVIAMGVMSDKVKQKQFALMAQKHNLWLGPAMVIYHNKAKNLREYINQQKSIDGEYKKSLLDYLINKISI